MDMKEYEMDKMWMMECMKEVDAKTPKEAMMMPVIRHRYFYAVCIPVAMFSYMQKQYT